MLRMRIVPARQDSCAGSFDPASDVFPIVASAFRSGNIKDAPVTTEVADSIRRF